MTTNMHMKSFISGWIEKYESKKSNDYELELRFHIDKNDFEYEINEDIYKIELKGSFDDWQKGYEIRYNEKAS